MVGNIKQVLLGTFCMAFLVFPSFSYANGENFQTRIFDLEFLWESDVETGPLFRMINQVSLSTKREILVLDTGALLIHYFTLDGEHLRSIGFYGEGPGQTTSACAFAVDKKNNIFILSPFGPAIINLNAQWEDASCSVVRLSELTGIIGVGLDLEIIGEDLLVANWRMAEKEIVFQVFSSDFKDEKSVLKRVRTSSKMLKKRSRVVERDMFFSQSRPWCVSSEGDLFIARERLGQAGIYWIDRIAKDGNVDISFGHEIIREKRNSTELSLAERKLLNGASLVEIIKAQGVEVVIEDYAPDIDRIYEVGGELWVKTSEKVGNDWFVGFDSFFKSGEFRGKILIKCSECDPTKDEVYFLEDMVVVVKGTYDAKYFSSLDFNDTADPFQIQCYNLKAEELK